MTLSITEAEYVALSACTQEVKFASIFLGETTRVQKPSIIYEDNQGLIFLYNKRQVGIHKRHIDIRHHFLQDMVEEKDIYIQYIQSEDNPVDIMTKNTSEADFARHMKMITRRKLWDIVDNVRDNVKRTGVRDNFTLTT